MAPIYSRQGAKNFCQAIDGDRFSSTPPLYGGRQRTSKNVPGGEGHAIGASVWTQAANQLLDSSSAGYGDEQQHTHSRIAAAHRHRLHGRHRQTYIHKQRDSTAPHGEHGAAQYHRQKMIPKTPPAPSQANPNGPTSRPTPQRREKNGWCLLLVGGALTTERACTPTTNLLFTVHAALPGRVPRFTTGSILPRRTKIKTKIIQEAVRSPASNGGAKLATTQAVQYTTPPSVFSPSLDVNKRFLLPKPFVPRDILPPPILPPPFLLPCLPEVSRLRPILDAAPADVSILREDDIQVTGLRTDEERCVRVNERKERDVVRRSSRASARVCVVA